MTYGLFYKEIIYKLVYKIVLKCLLVGLILDYLGNIILFGKLRIFIVSLVSYVINFLFLFWII